MPYEPASPARRARLASQRKALESMANALKARGVDWKIINEAKHEADEHMVSESNEREKEGKRKG